MTNEERLILDNQYAIMMELYAKSEDCSVPSELLRVQLDKMADLYNEEVKKPRRMM